MGLQRRGSELPARRAAAHSGGTPEGRDGQSGRHAAGPATCPRRRSAQHRRSRHRHGRARNRPRRPVRLGGPRPRRGVGGRRPARGHRSPAGQLFTQGLPPGQPSVPGHLSLLHLRHGSGPAARGGQGHVHGTRRDPGGGAPRRRTGLQGSVVHPRRPPGGAVGRGPAVARRTWLRLDAGLRPRDGHPGARGDRAAAPPQPRGDELVRALPPQARRTVDGHDAGNHVAAAVRDEGGGALRQPRQGSRGAAAHSRRRGPALDSVHHRPAGRHRGDARRAGRHHPRDSPGAPRVRARAGSDRAELPGQGPHRDGVDAGRRHRRVPGHLGGDAAGHGSQDAYPGTPQPGLTRGVPGADRCRGRRLGWRVAADPGPRQPRTALAGTGRTGRGHRRGGLRPGPAADRPAALCHRRCSLDRSAGGRSRRRAGRPADRVRA